MPTSSTQNRKKRRPRTRILWISFVVLATLSGAAFLPATLRSFEVIPVALAGEHSMRCYPDGYDEDGDGYGHGSLGPTGLIALHKTITWDGKLRTNCPRGYVRFLGDCDDKDPNVNPGKGEQGFNGKDDNCNDLVDEPTFVYFRDGNHNTTTGFQMLVKLNSLELLDRRAANNLYVEVRYARLVDSEHKVYESIRQIEPAFSPSSTVPIDVVLDHPEPATVFRARVVFYHKTDNGDFHRIGFGSWWYYTMTDGNSEKTKTRARIVLKGLKEYSDSQDGLVGYRGTEDRDGTRYGADRNEGFCTEFYVWVTKEWLHEVRGNSTWDEMVDHFKMFDSYYPPSEIQSRAAPGDYLPIDSDKDGKKNHSGMFLAYDNTTGEVWTLEGNIGNKVVIMSRALDTEIKGLGYLTQSQLNFRPHRDWIPLPRR